MAKADAEALASAFVRPERHERERSNVRVAVTLAAVYQKSISHDLEQLSHDEQLSPTIVHSFVGRPSPIVVIKL